MIRILDLLCNEQSSNYKFRKTEEDYEIEDVNNSLGATINEDDGVTYYVTGVYNSGTDWEEINVEALEDLKKLCESLAKDIKGGDSK